MGDVAPPQPSTAARFGGALSYQRSAATISRAPQLDADRTSSRARSSTFSFCSTVSGTAIS